MMQDYTLNPKKQISHFCSYFYLCQEIYFSFLMVTTFPHIEPKYYFYKQGVDSK